MATVSKPDIKPDISDIAQFRGLLITAINYRKGILDPDNPLLILPIDPKGEDIIIKELRLLENILSEFNKLFL